METTSYFSELANFLLNGMGTNLFHKSNNMISGIAPVFQIGFGIYILLVAFDYTNGGLMKMSWIWASACSAGCLLLLLLSIPVSIRNSPISCGCCPKI